MDFSQIALSWFIFLTFYKATGLDIGPVDLNHSDYTQQTKACWTYDITVEPSLLPCCSTCLYLERLINLSVNTATLPSMEAENTTEAGGRRLLGSHVLEGISHMCGLQRKEEKLERTWLNLWWFYRAVILSCPAACAAIGQLSRKLSLSLSQTETSSYRWTWVWGLDRSHRGGL